MSPMTSGPTKSSQLETAFSRTPQALVNSCTIRKNVTGRWTTSAPGEHHVHDHDPSIHHDGSRPVHTHNLRCTRPDRTDLSPFSCAGRRWDRRHRQLGSHYALRNETGTRP